MNLIAPYLNIIKLGGLALLLALLGLQTWRVSSLKGDLEACNARNTAQVAAYRTAAAEQIATQTAAKAKTETAQAAKTKEIDDDFSHRSAVLVAAVAAAHQHDSSVRPSTQTDPVSAGRPDLPQASTAAQSPDGPGGNSAPAEVDDRVCGINTLRLIEAHKWAVDQAALQAPDKETHDTP